MQPEFTNVRIEGSPVSVANVPEALESFAEVLEDLAHIRGVEGAVASWGGVLGGPTVNFSISGEDLIDIVQRSEAYFLLALDKAGIGGSAIERLTVFSDDVMEAELEQEPESYLGVTEVAELFGVSRQRASILRTTGGFPSPVADLKAGPIWTRSSLQRFLDSWDRTPGRKRKVS